MTQILTFAEAIDQASEEPHVLLGNGFSIAWDYHAFSYESLMTKANFGEMHCEALSLFGRLETTDFEVAIERLRATDLIVRLYDPKSEIAQKAAADAEVLRDALAAALALNHPENVGSVSEEQYDSVRTFLSHFKCAFSLNYDLLLYWATMQEDDRDVPRGDGFASDPDDPDAPWVVWDMAHSWSQKVHYLHGALHLFDAGDRLRKITWKRTSVPLVDQIRSQLAERSYPHVVTEGRSKDKLDKIMHSAYLSKAFRSFAAIGGKKNDLFIYGHSLAENDEHILDAIERGKVQRLFVSVYGDPARPANQAMIARALAMSDRRGHHTDHRAAKALTVQFYDAESASVWG